MHKSIYISDIKERPVIEVPAPKLIPDQDGRPIERDGLPVFAIKADPLDYDVGKPSSVKQAFHDRFVINPDSRVKPLQLAVFHGLARTTQWADVCIIVGGDKKPVLLPNGNGQAALIAHGNQTATRTIQQLSVEVGASYSATQKALIFWEEIGIISRIKTYEKQSVKEDHRQSGRKTEFRRYEIDPDYVWNGYIWIGTGYKAYTMGSIVLVSE